MDNIPKLNLHGLSSPRGLTPEKRNRTYRKSSRKQVKEEFICPICKDYYKTPKGLPCLHSFCRTCLKGHILTVKRSFPVRGSNFNCPVCRMMIMPPDPIQARRDWVDQFPNNHQMIRLMEKVFPDVKWRPCVPCKSRNVNQMAVRTCVTCKEDYCQECSNFHKRFKATKQHMQAEIKYNIHRPIDDMSDDNRSVSDRGQNQFHIEAKFNRRLDLNFAEKSPGNITSIVFVDNDNIVLSDGFDKRLMLYRDSQAEISAVLGKIKCVSILTGETKWEQPANTPRAVALCGNKIFVANIREEKIQVFSRNGRFIQTLLNRRNKIRRPQAISVNPDGSKLAVCVSPPDESDYILVYDLVYHGKFVEKEPEKQKSSTCTIS
ncbi:unnamed protein product [Mytilus edulis]|uniref:RING-type domain-containing protein n=1 Tax=Mytilus edulis TaxID=6550 RepID=A0A8S3STX1_MYTED|nr:unnamed protein product [Mytilus edulis]